MDRQTLRDWAHRFNGEGPEGLTDRPRAGRPRRLSDAQMAELAEIVVRIPTDCDHCFRMIATTDSD